MKKISSPLNLAALFTATFICYSPAAQADSSARWVHGSWVNVRAKPEANAAVLTHLVANTPVQLDVAASSGKYCAISWGQGQQGFIACNLLGDKALRMEDFVDSDHRTVDSTNYFPARMFWLEPNLHRLLDAGRYFQETMLSPQQKALETVDSNFVWEKRPAIKRFPIPEFEAMKQHMMAGIIEPASPYIRPPALWDDILNIAKTEELPGKKATEASSSLNSSLFYPGVLVMLRQLDLPVAAPSYFKSLPELGRPSATPEELSRQYQISYAIKPAGGPYWNDYEPSGIGVVGWWDLGKLDIFLQKPVIKHSLMLSGKLISTSSDLKYSISNANCNEGFRFGGPAVQTEPVQSLAKRRIQPRANDEPVFRFYTQGKLPALTTPASITMQAPKQLQYDGKSKKQRHEQFTQAAISTFDLDHDGIADFAVVEAWHVGPFSALSTPEASYRVIFVNAGGRWYLFDIDEYNICGC